MSDANELAKIFVAAGTVAFIVLALLGFIVLCAGLFGKDELGEKVDKLEKKLSDPLKEVEAQREADRRELEAERQRMTEELEQREAEIGQLKAQAEEEAHDLVLTAQAQVQQVMRPLSETQDMAAREAVLSELIFVRAFSCPLMTVKYLAGPSGRIGFEWVLHDRRYLRVIVRRDGKLIFSDYSPNNRLGDKVEPGTRHFYSFEIHEGRRILEDKLKAEILVPKEDPKPPAPAAPPPPPPRKPKAPDKLKLEFEKFASHRERLAKMKADAIRGVEEQRGLSEDEKRRRLAEIDAWFARKSAEEG